MPVDLREHDPDDSIDLQPGTNKSWVIQLLYSDTNLGYTPSEIRSELDIPSGSVYTTLSRLKEDGYIGKTEDGLYHGLEHRDDLKRFASSLVQIEGLFRRHPESGVDPDDVVQTGGKVKKEIPEERLQKAGSSEEEPSPEDWIVDEE